MTAQAESETTRSHVESYLEKGVNVLGDDVLRLWLILTIYYVHVQPSLLGIKGKQTVKLPTVQTDHRSTQCHTQRRGHLRAKLPRWEAHSRFGASDYPGSEALRQPFAHTPGTDQHQRQLKKTLSLCQAASSPGDQSVFSKSFIISDPTAGYLKAIYADPSGSSRAYLGFS